MKIIINSLEVAEIVRKAYNLPPDVEVEIDSKVSGEITALVERIDALLRDGNKISAIKEYRGSVTSISEAGYFGLKEAKDAIEHWSDIRLSILKFNRRVRPVYAPNGDIQSFK